MEYFLLGVRGNSWNPMAWVPGRETWPLAAQAKPNGLNPDIIVFRGLHIMTPRFSNKKKALSICLPLLILATSGTASATPLGSADMFNAYSRTTFNYNTVDIEGIIGASGDITYIGGDTGRYATSAHPYSIYGGGDVTIQNHHIYNGGVQADGNVSISATTIGGDVEGKDSVFINGGSFSGTTAPTPSITSEGNVTLQSLTVQNGTVHVGGHFDNEWGGNFSGSTLVMGPGATTSADGWYLDQGSVTTGPAPSVDVIDHAQVSADIVSASQSYASAPSNGTLLNPWAEQWVFQGDESINIFDIDGSDLAHIASFSFEGSRDATYVINVLGTDVDFGLPSDFIGGFFINGTSMTVDNADDISSKILFNFVNATNLDIYGSVFGSILAPYADIYYTSGAINGSVYANAISGNGQINAISFDGEGVTTEVPAPAPLALLLGGLVPLMLSRKAKA